jgi:hypothetical protein
MGSVRSSSGLGWASTQPSASAIGAGSRTFAARLSSRSIACGLPGRSASQRCVQASESSMSSSASKVRESRSHDPPSGSTAVIARSSAARALAIGHAPGDAGEGRSPPARSRDRPRRPAPP